MHGVPTLFDSQRELSQKTLTDFEVEGLKAPLSLADGHAYQDLSGVYSDILRELPSIWSWGIDTAIPDAEAYFLAAFAKLAKASSLQRQRHFRICPTASNSIDIVGAFLAARNLGVALVEPTFDNLALLLRRRKVPIFPVPENAIYEDLSKEARLRDFPTPTAIGALFLVNPNNPTGRELSNDQLAQLVDLCAGRGWVLILDNSFRFHSRKSLDDYGVLNASGIPYICIENTGKTFPTLDMKASLLLYSESCAHVIEEIYGELFLCVSNFTLGLLGRLMELTERSGLRRTVWPTVDGNRRLLRQILAPSLLAVPDNCLPSTLSVEWLTLVDAGKRDFDLCAELKQRGLAILPGRHFYWASHTQSHRQRNVRISLMKSHNVFQRALGVLHAYSAHPH